MGDRKANASEPLMMCRKLKSGIRTGVLSRSRDKSGGCPVYWPGGARHEGGASLFCGFCTERGKAGSDNGACWLFLGQQAARGRALGDRNREAQSTDAEFAGGPARSSGDAPVTGAERRGRLI